ncbi:hypothetical protein MSG28_008679 [Choristoneura fumiferana]|uniref:Uncharacterized protein n=1 Tax=Choristoneura fumiferana TaxID=7141 RepID=A0ACC0J7L5_CHOFU|nr:hypothetical protein MSG28_008679 [Choristoneura fumiferana]
MSLNPRKYLIKELLNKPSPFDVWLQGTIEQNVGNDILIIADTSGRAKITKCENADGVIDNKSLQKGKYCCILGTAVKTKGLPEVQASKFVDLTSQPHMKEVWEDEIREANLILENKIKPSI